MVVAVDSGLLMRESNFKGVRNRLAIYYVADRRSQDSRLESVVIEHVML